MTSDSERARKRIRTYITGFDDAICGGIPSGSICLVSGAPGTMKSSLAFSVLYNNATRENRKCAYFTLEQNKTYLLDHMINLGMGDGGDFQNLVIIDMGNIRKNLSFMKAKGSWIELLKMYIGNLVKSEKISLIALDSLDVLETMARFDDRRTELYYLFEWLRDLNITAFIISERPLDSSRTGRYTDEAYLADGIIHVGLHQTSDVYVQRRIRCVKMRSTKHETNYFALIWEDGQFEVTRAVSSVG
jgi:circadian clock protein KaiC